MKTKNKFFGDEDTNFHAKKKDKFGNCSQKNTVTDKLGNPIRIGDFVQTVAKDGTFLEEGEVIDMANGNELTLLHEDGETIKIVHSNKVILLAI
jgi:hypothetical protein